MDFWATWCGSCRAELPNVRQNYETYHDRGFEIVGVSLDSDREALEEFLADEQIPWANLFAEGETGGWKHPLAVKYGVQAIPAAFLVDRDGKVIAQDVRGAELGKQLEKLLAMGENKPNQSKPAEPRRKTNGRKAREAVGGVALRWGPRFGTGGVAARPFAMGPGVRRAPEGARRRWFRSIGISYRTNNLPPAGYNPRHSVRLRTAHTTEPSLPRPKTLPEFPTTDLHKSTATVLPGRLRMN